MILIALLKSKYSVPQPVDGLMRGECTIKLCYCQHTFLPFLNC